MHQDDRTFLPRPLNGRRRIAGVVMAVVASAGLSMTLGGCGAGKDSKAQARPAPVSVDVQTVSRRPVQLWSEFSGHLQAVDYVEVRPEVDGRIAEVRIHDGQIVRAGDVLFVIDPRPFRAALARAAATLESARTDADLARSDLKRATSLVKSQALAMSVYDQRVNADRVARAAVEKAEAEWRQARIDIDHAYVKAPISGRVSRPEITLGNLVETGKGSQVLTSIVSMNGIYAVFDVDEQTYLNLFRGQHQSEDLLRSMPVQLRLPGDTDRVYKGTVYSFDNRINSSTGTIRARAKFPNHDGSLIPGMYVSIRMSNSDRSTAMLVPKKAIVKDQNKQFVYVVGPDGTIAYREIRVGQQAEGQRVVLKGLVDGDRVVVDGQQRVRPGQKVVTRP
jgi:multidrug efflux system membrane fusion protein